MKRKVGQETERKTEMATEPLKEDGSIDSIRRECEALKRILDKAYQEPTLMGDAEMLAARFLSAQMLIADELRKVDLDSRMKKNGVKALKAATWYAAATADEKKPSDKLLDSVVDKDSLVQAEQDKYDRADAYRENLQTYLGIFKDAHIYFRGIAKGRYE